MCNPAGGNWPDFLSKNISEGWGIQDISTILSIVGLVKSGCLGKLATSTHLVCVGMVETSHVFSLLDRFLHPAGFL